MCKWNHLRGNYFFFFFFTFTCSSQLLTRLQRLQTSDSVFDSLSTRTTYTHIYVYIHIHTTYVYIIHLSALNEARWMTSIWIVVHIAKVPSLNFGCHLNQQKPPPTFSAFFFSFDNLFFYVLFSRWLHSCKIIQMLHNFRGQFSTIKRGNWGYNYCAERSGCPDAFLIHGYNDMTIHHLHDHHHHHRHCHHRRCRSRCRWHRFSFYLFDTILWAKLSSTSAPPLLLGFLFSDTVYTAFSFLYFLFWLPN